MFSCNRDNVTFAFAGGTHPGLPVLRLPGLHAAPGKSLPEPRAQRHEKHLQPRPVNAESGMLM